MEKISRIIIDTNLWISFLITKNYTQLDLLIYSKKCILLFSDDLLDEFLEVVARPKLSRYFSRKDIEMLLETIEEYAELVKVTSLIRYLKDEKDDFLLSLAIDGKADFLITGDKELLKVNKYFDTQIISISDFVKRLENV
jgi:uncharacterized protein